MFQAPPLLRLPDCVLFVSLPSHIYYSERTAQPPCWRKTKRPPTASRWVYELSMGNRLPSAICSPSCLSATVRSASRPGSDGKRETGEQGRVLPFRTPFPIPARQPLGAAGHAHEERPHRSTPLGDPSAPTPEELSGRSSWARPIENAARDHVTPTVLRRKARGFHHPRGGH